ncbi:MAG: acyl carrier protein [Oscillospiraceae bacterium]|nr:acyl carrier protein [Oscillospiraceae bacterium]
MTNIEKYNRIFMMILGANERDLDEDYTFANIHEWDSLAHMHLIGELEDVFDILFETEEILRFVSYENGKRILERHGVSFGR